MDHRPSPKEVDRIENMAKEQNQNELQASQSVQETIATTLPQRNQKTQEDQPNILE